MCGIVGYVGRQKAATIMLEGLKRLEYRGYDSAGLAVRAAAAEGGAIVVLDRRRNFYPPAAAALGVELEQVMVVRAGSPDDELWAFDQALRCPGVAAVWGAIDKLPSRWFRRLQLAAENGGGVGHVLRPARVRGWPSWSYAQLLVEPLPSAAAQSAGGRRWRSLERPEDTRACTQPFQNGLRHRRALGGAAETLGWNREGNRDHARAVKALVEAN